jgi:hypothetical protein
MDEQRVQMLSDDLYFCTVILTRKNITSWKYDVIAYYLILYTR